MIRERVTTIIRQRPELLRLAALLLVILAGVIAYLLLSGGGTQQGQTDKTGRRILYWYDPMVPTERYPGPGKS